jgi:hypothetical protein
LVDKVVKPCYNTHIDTKEQTMRKYTTSLLEMMDDGVMDAKAVAEMCLAYMSEADVEDMMRGNDLLLDEEDEADGQPDEAQEWESFDPDC